MRKKSKLEKSILALLVMPDILGITILIVAVMIYFFLR